MDDEIEQHETGFYLGDLNEMDHPPSDQLTAEIGWRAAEYDFDFYAAPVMGESEMPSASWIEVAYSRHLGGAFVVWFSGVSGLEANDFCSYGFVECRDLKAGFDQAFLRRSLLQGAPILGYHFNSEAYYASVDRRGQVS